MIDWNKVKEDNSMTKSELHESIMLAALSIAAGVIDETGASKYKFIGDDGDREIVMTVKYGKDV